MKKNIILVLIIAIFIGTISVAAESIIDKIASELKESETYNMLKDNNNITINTTNNVVSIFIQEKLKSENQVTTNFTVDNGIINYKFPEDKKTSNDSLNLVIDSYWIKEVIQQVGLANGYTAEQLKAIENDKQLSFEENGIEAKYFTIEKTEESLLSGDFVDTLKIDYNNFNIDNLLEKANTNTTTNNTIIENNVTNNTVVNSNKDNPETGYFLPVALIVPLTIGAIYVLANSKRKAIISKF